MKGTTYSLRDASGSAEAYYLLVAGLADRLTAEGETAVSLRARIRRASRKTFVPCAFLPSRDRALISTLDEALGPRTVEGSRRLRAIGLKWITDPMLLTGRRRHHLYMLEIELTNRINRQAFARAPWRMALVAHCLRDVHESCAAVPGDVEQVCGRCRPDCLVRLGSELAGRHGVHPYIAATMDHERLFEDLARRHPGMAAMGIACVPELVMGLRLVERLGIPAVGIPLDANLCARWRGEALPTAFSLKEMERLMGGD